jgi:hypothetical protein
MTFENLNKDSACNCLDGAAEDLTSTFGLKTNTNVLKESSFKSKWEKGDIPEGNDCKVICSKKGLSLSYWDEESKDKVTAIFKQLFPITPQYKPFLSVIKLKNGAGKVKHTPSNKNPFHYDLYKSDSFDLNSVTHINSISLADNV